MVNELANMIPCLNSLVLDGFLRETAARPVNSIIGGYSKALYLLTGPHIDF